MVLQIYVALQIYIYRMTPARLLKWTRTNITSEMWFCCVTILAWLLTENLTFFKWVSYTSMLMRTELYIWSLPSRQSACVMGGCGVHWILINVCHSMSGQCNEGSNYTSVRMWSEDIDISLLTFQIKFAWTMLLGYGRSASSKGIGMAP